MGAWERRLAERVYPFCVFAKFKPDIPASQVWLFEISNVKNIKYLSNKHGARVSLHLINCEAVKSESLGS